MQRLETKRLVIRAFSPDDWPDVHELAVDWSSAPGPAFDKWPTTEDACRGFATFLSKDDRFFAVCLRDTGKVIGLLALNGIDANEQLDLGHVIHSTCQDNDLDREALGETVGHVFTHQDVLSIVTRNAPDHAEQLAPLRSLGFRNRNTNEAGELVISRAEWERSGNPSASR